MKLPEHLVLPELYVGICTDLCREYPEYTMHIVRFLRDLNKRCDQRGVERTLCIDLPKLGKLYDKALSSGYMPVSSDTGVYHGVRPKSSSEDYGITPLLELTLRRESAEWVPRHPVQPTLVFYTRTLLYTAKKINREARPDVKEKCESEFFSLDAEVDESVDYNLLSREVFDAVKARYIPSTYPTWDELHFRHGPGSVCDLAVKKGECKFTFPNWSERLQEWFPYEEFAFHKYNVDAEFPGGDIAAKVSSVPKTLDKVRVITVEPTSNQFVQQGLRRWMLRNQTDVAQISIDTTDQSLSRQAAKDASIDGSYATVDLKSASDSLSLALVKDCFSTNRALLDMLLACRSEYVRTPEGKLHRLKKYAGQGNATTFMVQSLVYSILATCAVIESAKGLTFAERPQNELKLTKGLIAWAAKKVRVFGDDIILPSSSVHYFYMILDEVGLVVNNQKSHIGGRFREACGGDFFHGSDVTPFYIKEWRPPANSRGKKYAEELVAWADVSNNAYAKGLLGTAQFMRDQVDLPVNSPSAPGYTSRLSFRYSPEKGRWNEDLQRVEFLERIPVTVSNYVDTGYTFGRLYKWFVEAPSQEVNWEGRRTKGTAVKLKRRWVA